MRIRTLVGAVVGAATALTTLVAAPGTFGAAVARAGVEPPVATALDVSRPVHVFARAVPVTETLTLRFSTPVDGSVTATLRPPRGSALPVRFELADEYGLAWRAKAVLPPTAALGTWTLDDIRWEYTDDRGAAVAISAPETSAFTLRHASTVEIGVDRKRLRAGRTLTVYGRVLSLYGDPVAKAPLELQGRVGSGAWEKLRAYRTTKDGWVVARGPAEGSLQLRWRMPGTTTVAASTSPVVTVSVS
ncbi:hypothetical protein [Motilibacter deserti]|uniref:Ig-like domain-containing protein n=1 Tax=Motilibacter deserti TaxID=2714956 RepID=A0ABX0GRW9_9ACTN|nr:hypothetical protein [Motilibacter deserti]NHC13602.1 hypothetical protein [Motilibacter deserti]